MAFEKELSIDRGQSLTSLFPLYAALYINGLCRNEHVLSIAPHIAKNLGLTAFV